MTKAMGDGLVVKSLIGQSIAFQVRAQGFLLIHTNGGAGLHNSRPVKVNEEGGSGDQDDADDDA